MPVGRMEHGARSIAAPASTVVVAIIKTPAQNKKKSKKSIERLEAF